MTYTVLARRYRSRDFDEVVGQEPIARTLKRAIESGRTAHAYLFSGTRGVGKTSMARIFAKAINVTDELEDEQSIADAIMRGEDLDVIEIDGASNNRVEDARELIANSIYRPARCQYKIYIIDEVHMLSNSAFNALLKTMEEPPSHVKFILCTTEPEKVPATIQSRCQRFDFRAIPHNRIVDHLRNVLAQEQVEADDAVIHHVARLGNGSMRDALSVLERLLASGEKTITRELLEQTLGLPDFDLINQAVDAIGSGNPAGVLHAAGQLADRGISTDQTLDVLIDTFRELMILNASGPDTPLVQFASDEERDQRLQQARSFDLGGLVHTIVVLENVQRAAKASGAARALLEAALVRLALSDQVANLASVLRDPRTIARLPVDLSGAAGAASPQAVAAGADWRKKKRLTEPQSGNSSDSAGVGETSPHAVHHADPASGPSPTPARSPAPGSSLPVPPQAAGATTSPASAPPATPVADIRSLWSEVLRRAEDPANQGLSVVIDSVELVTIEGRTAVLALHDEGLGFFAQSKAKPLADLISDVAGRPLQVRIDQSAGRNNAGMQGGGGGRGSAGHGGSGGLPPAGPGPGRQHPNGAPGGGSTAARSPGTGHEVSPVHGGGGSDGGHPPIIDPAEQHALRDEASRDPMVRQAMEMLNARIVHVDRIRPHLAGDGGASSEDRADRDDDADQPDHDQPRDDD